MYLSSLKNSNKSFDRALIRRFDSVVDFSEYTKEDLVDVAEKILNKLLLKFKSAGRNISLFRKILNTNENTVGSRLRRGRQKLIELLEGEGIV